MDCRAVLPQKSGQYFFESLEYLQHVQQSGLCASGFFGALDDEEFFVVEGSGGGGVAGSLTPR